MNARPNVIFIHNDHQSFYQYQDYDVKPRRPNFDRLAAEGVLFTNAYCASPLCGPTRRTLLHGVYQHTHKQYYNRSAAPYQHEVYLDTFADAGYENYYYGKYHAGPGNALQFKHVLGLSHEDYGNPYVREDYKQYIRRKGLPPFEAKIKRVFRSQPTEYGEKGNPYYEDLVEDNAHYTSKDPFYCGEHCTGVTTTPRESTESFFLASLACDKLEELASDKNRKKPFTLRVDFWGPHQPYFPTQEYLDMYKDVMFPPYPSWNSKLSGKPKAYHHDRNLPIANHNVINIPNTLPWSFYNELMQYACAQITMVDEAAGLILKKLREVGLNDNTLIILGTDHGDALACHGGHFDKESYMCQEVLRVPLAMKWSGRINPGTIIDKIVNTVDIPITMLDAAGLKITKNKIHGKSLLPLAECKINPNSYENVTFCETNGHTTPVFSRVIVMDNYKYVATADDIDELYDINKDKYELTNLIDNPSYTPVLNKLRNRLLQWQKETEDTLIFDWTPKT